MKHCASSAVHCRAHASAWDCFRRVPAVLALDVRDRLGHEFGAYARHGVLSIPSETEEVARLPARGMTAPALEQLHQPREVKPRAGSYQQVHVSLEEAERHDRGALLNRDLSKVLLEKSTRGRVDHRSSRQRGPGKVEVDAVCRHGRDPIVWSKMATLINDQSMQGSGLSHSEEWAHEALRLKRSAVSGPRLGRGRTGAGRGNGLRQDWSRRSAARAWASSPSARPSQTASSMRGSAAERSSMRSQVRTRRKV